MVRYRDATASSSVAKFRGEFSHSRRKMAQ
jgi:hypothetical protein